MTPLSGTRKESQSMSKINRGGCLCGAVRYETKGPLRDVIACHCVECRRQSGHYFAATASADADLEVTGGENLTWYCASDDARRGFCRTCGSVLFWKRNGSDRTSILAGSFDSPSGLMPGYHIFCAEKGDYYEIADGLPCYDDRGPS